MVSKQYAARTYETFIEGLKKVLHSEQASIYLTGDFCWIEFDDEASRFNIDPITLELDYFCYEGRFDDFHDLLMDCRDYIRRHRRDFDSIIWCIKNVDRLVDENEKEKNEL